MAKTPFRFAIMQDPTHYFGLAGGAVTISGTANYLPSSIVDWQTLALNYRRHGTFLGVIRSYSPDAIRLVKDGAKILRFIKNTMGGKEAVAYLQLSILNTTTQQYDVLDYWQFDFSRAKNKQLYFDAALMEGGASALLQAYQNANYATPLNDPVLSQPYPIYNPTDPTLLPLTLPIPAGVLPPPPVPQQIFCDSIPILGKFQYVSEQTYVPGTVFGGSFTGEIIDVVTDLAAQIFTLGMVEFQSLGDYGGSVGVTNNPQKGLAVGTAVPADAKCFTANMFAVPFKMSIAYNLSFAYENRRTSATHINLQLKYQVFDGVGGGYGSLVGGNVIAHDPIGLSMGTTSPQLNWKGVSAEFDMQPGFLLFIGFSFVATGTDLGGVPPCRVRLNPLSAPPAQPVACIELNYKFIPQNSVVRAISQAQLFDYLAAQMFSNGGTLDNTYATRSNLLNTSRDPTLPGNGDIDPTRTFFTCGDALRGLKTATITDPYYNGGLPTDVFLVPAIYTNMSDFAKDLLANLCASIGIERTGFGTDTLVAEHLTYFFDDTVVIADLGTDIADFEMEEYNDFCGTTITMGENDQQFDSINGPLETMSQVEWGSVITRIQKAVDMKTPYREEPYGIEITRANIGNKTNVNSSSDNDTFKLQVSDLIPTIVFDLEYWGGLSGYAFTTYALRLQRAANINSGLPAELLTPNVNPYSMYNLCFSPQRKAQRVLPWLTSNYRGLVNNLMNITSYKKNISLVSQIYPGSPVITENDWLNMSDTPQTYTPPFKVTPVTVQSAETLTGRAVAPIFKPYTFSFTSKVPVNLPLMMTPPGTPGGGKMYGKIKFIFTRDNIQYPLNGFVLEAGITPGTRATYKYKLLCGPKVNIPPTL